MIWDIYWTGVGGFFGWAMCEDFEAPIPNAICALVWPVSLVALVGVVVFFTVRRALHD